VKLRSADERAVVAAVCYRRAEIGVELLLVRTKDGRGWTFPKGHVKKHETPWEAAAREAREEAGVEGEIEQTPFTHYLYPNTRKRFGRRPPSRVAAFLLAVTAESRAEEGFREPRWVTPQEAVTKLGEGREPPYAEEHARAVRAALEALG
jgi:8-oxo-dGTP pyrophosphatase MutT (NUDIX family)